MCSTSRVARSGPNHGQLSLRPAQTLIGHLIATFQLGLMFSHTGQVLYSLQSALGQLCNFLYGCVEHVDKTGIHFQPCPPFTHNFISVPHFLSPCRHSLSLLVLHFNPAHPPGLHLCPCCLGGVSMETGQQSSGYLLRNSLANSLARWANAGLFL